MGAFEKTDSEPSSGSAFELMIKANAAYLRALALRLTSNRDFADDLVQETLRCAIRRFGQFEPGMEARVWLTKILGNLYLYYLRHEVVVMKTTPEFVELNAKSDLDAGFCRIPPDALWDAVAALDLQLRCVIELRYREELSFEAIAQQLKISTGTVITRVNRALYRLLRQLRQRAA